MLVRILERQYMDAFFQRGALRLSTLARCRTLEDQNRRDSTEGSSRFGLTYGGKGLYGMQKFGMRSYLLCLSDFDDLSQIALAAGEACFRIDNVDAFGEAISKEIDGCKGFRHGHCVYVPDKVIDHVSHVPIMPDPTELLRALQTGNQQYAEEAVNKMNRGLSEIVEALPDPIFYKPDTFSHEMEHRLIWECGEDASDFIDVTCPAAIRWCTPLV